MVIELGRVTGSQSKVSNVLRQFRMEKFGQILFPVTIRDVKIRTGYMAEFEGLTLFLQRRWYGHPDHHPSSDLREGPVDRMN